MLIEFNIMPTIEITHTIPNITHPNFPPSVINAIGVYVPAINKNIDVWSNTLNTLLAFLFVNTWYSNITRLAPYTKLLITLIAPPLMDADTINITHAAMQAKHLIHELQNSRFLLLLDKPALHMLILPQILPYVKKIP